MLIPNASHCMSFFQLLLHSRSVLVLPHECGRDGQQHMFPPRLHHRRWLIHPTSLFISGHTPAMIFFPNKKGEWEDPLLATPHLSPLTPVELGGRWRGERKGERIYSLHVNLYCAPVTITAYDGGQGGDQSRGSFGKINFRPEKCAPCFSL